MNSPTILAVDLDETLLGKIASESKARKKGLEYINIEGFFGGTYALRPKSRKILDLGSAKFDYMVLWTHHGTAETIKENLNPLSILSYFSEIIGSDHSLNKGNFPKSLDKLAELYKTPIENVVLIQDDLFNISIAASPVERVVPVKAFNPNKLLSQYDRSLLKAYNQALELVFG